MSFSVSSVLGMKLIGSLAPRHTRGDRQHRWHPSSLIVPRGGATKTSDDYKKENASRTVELSSYPRITGGGSSFERGRGHQMSSNR
jgi:hypothetical protein